MCLREKEGEREREREGDREKEKEKGIKRERNKEQESKTHHQQLDLVNQRGRCKELVDGRQYFPFQRGSASGVLSSRASGPDVRPLAGTGQQLPAVARPEISLLQLFRRALVALLFRCAPSHPQRSRLARVGIRTGDRLARGRFPEPLGHPVGFVTSRYRMENFVQKHR